MFDLDGVLFNSKSNMKISWEKTKKLHGLKKSFNHYFLLIGNPFSKILFKLGIKKNHQKIEKTFKETSIKNINLVKPYPNVKKIINYLRKKKN